MEVYLLHINGKSKVSFQNIQMGIEKKHKQQRTRRPKRFQLRSKETNQFGTKKHIKHQTWQKSSMPLAYTCLCHLPEIHFLLIHPDQIGEQTCYFNLCNLLALMSHLIH